MLTKYKNLFMLQTGFITLAIVFILNWAQGINRGDECWFLYLMQRLSSGDVLYRDFFLGVTPLSAYITYFFTNLFGIELLVIKFVVACCETITIWTLVKITRQLKLSNSFSIWFILLLLVMTSTNLQSVYSSLANMFFALSFSSLLAWQDNYPGNINKNLFWAAFLAGLGFSAKQNIGIYLISILYILIGLQSWDWKKKKLKFGHSVALMIFTTLFFLLPIIITLIPIMLTGGFEKFIEYGFINKRNYLQYAKIPYWDGLLTVWTLIKNFLSVPSINFLTAWFQSTFFVFPIISFFLVLFHFLFCQISTRFLTVFLIMIASLGDVYPRADLTHLVFSIPYLLLGIAYCWQQLTSLFSNSIKNITQILAISVALLWLFFGLSIQLITFITKARNESYTFSMLSHLHGMLIPTKDQNEMFKIIPQLKNYAIKSLFILSPYASFYYLVADIKNPTAYDYPLNTAFGLNGEVNVISSIKHKTIKTVCLESYNWMLSPIRLENYVKTHMEKKQQVGPCMLYENEN